jgi:hypothetical protein
MKFMYSEYAEEAREQMEYYACWNYADHVVEFYHQKLRRYLNLAR